MLKPEIIEKAKEAGFVFWENESWGPGPGHIDWSAVYDKEFEKFIELMGQTSTREVYLSKLEVERLYHLMTAAGDEADVIKITLGENCGIGNSVSARPVCDMFKHDVDITDVGSW